MWQDADVPRSGVPPHPTNQTYRYKSTTTPGECDMWKNSDVPMSEYIPTLIEPSGTDSYYTRSNEFKIKDERYTPC